MHSITKSCSKCNRVLPATAEHFYRHPNGKYGLESWCKECRLKGRRERYERTKDEYLAQCREYYRRNRERVASRVAQYRKANPDKVKQWTKRYRSQEYVRAKIRKRSKKRYHSDPMIRLNACVSTAVRECLRGGKGGRSWEELVGYTLDELRVHLENQFVRGMTWSNYGKSWHIDHIRPLSSFEYADSGDSQFREAWSLLNLRPLWARANKRKSAKWDGQLTLPLG